MQVFERLDRKNDGKIDKEELQQQFDDLGYRPRKITDYGNSEVEDIIWEVRGRDAALYACGVVLLL